MTSRWSRLVLLAALIGALPARASGAEAPRVARAEWARAMGQSGLRRFYSTGAELGELVNRQVSYQVASRIASAPAQASAGPPFLAVDSSVRGHVLQFDSLTAVGTTLGRPLYARTLGRVAARLEPDKVRSRNDRYDLGLLLALSPGSYVSAGLALEDTDVSLRYVPGTTDTDAVGLRIDAGFRINPVLALGIRVEELQIQGDNAVEVRGASGPLRVARELDVERSFLQLEGILRLTREQVRWLPSGAQVGGMAGVHYLDSIYEPEINSLGQRVAEPFGNRERLGVFRVGGFVSSNLTAKWNAYAELLLDREFETNLNRPIDDRTSALWRMGIAWLPARGKRVSFDLNRSESREGRRERDNFLVILVMDF